MELLQTVVKLVPPQLVLCIWVALTHIKSVWSPLYRSYYAKPPVQYPNNEVVSSLQSLLRDQKGLERFKEFLVGEFSVENLLFFLDVEEYRGISDTAQRQTVAQHLFNTYIIEGSMLEVNINFKSKRTIHAGIVSPSVYTFDHAQEEIYHLMEQDSFNRFKKVSFPSLPPPLLLEGGPIAQLTPLSLSLYLSTRPPLSLYAPFGSLSLDSTHTLSFQKELSGEFFLCVNALRPPSLTHTTRAHALWLSLSLSGFYSHAHVISAVR